MPTQINLLPWRETHRKEKNRQYGLQMLAVALLAGGIGFGGFKFAEDKVNFQLKRNERLNTEIALLQEELEQIKELEQTKSNLLARMEIIQQLQGQRPQIVHTFYEIAQRIPDGVFLKTMKQSGEKQMVLEGRAESNARVSALMRTLDRSDFFTNPRLEVIEADKQDGISTFRLLLEQIAPKPEVENDDVL